MGLFIFQNRNLKMLQKLLTKRVKKVWKTCKKKMNAIIGLSSLNYQTKIGCYSLNLSTSKV